DEFKSGARMDRNSAQVSARALLKGVATRFCRIGIAIAPEADRRSFGDEALRCLDKILTTNELDSVPHDVYFDEGLFPNSSYGQSSANRICRNQNCKFHFEQNSIVVKGLQVADLIAHTCATMLLSELGLMRKMVRVGENSGYDPNLEVGLEFELWSGIRYHFFAADPPPIDSWKSQSDFQADVESNGLHIADSCDEKLRKAAI